MQHIHRHDTQAAADESADSAVAYATRAATRSMAKCQVHIAIEQNQTIRSHRKASGYFRCRLPVGMSVSVDARNWAQSIVVIGQSVGGMGMFGGGVFRNAFFVVFRLP
jgi:hypothetical protein